MKTGGLLEWSGGGEEAARERRRDNLRLPVLLKESRWSFCLGADAPAARPPLGEKRFNLPSSHLSTL